MLRARASHVSGRVVGECRCPLATYLYFSGRSSTESITGSLVHVAVAPSPSPAWVRGFRDLGIQGFRALGLYIAGPACGAGRAAFGGGPRRGEGRT